MTTNPFNDVAPRPASGLGFVTMGAYLASASNEPALAANAQLNITSDPNAPGVNQ